MVHISIDMTPNMTDSKHLIYTYTHRHYLVITRIITNNYYNNYYNCFYVCSISLLFISGHGSVVKVNVFQTYSSFNHRIYNSVLTGGTTTTTVYIACAMSVPPVFFTS